MRDSDGAEICVGDRCEIISGDDAGLIVWIHRVRPSFYPELPSILVVDCHPSLNFMTNEDQWTVAVWVRGGDIKRIGGAS